MNTITTTAKPWYRHRRYWVMAIFVLLVYFCLIPAPLHISPETTGISEPIPLTKNGLPDYFAAYEKTWADKLFPPEDNGQRLMIAACGPQILEQASLAELPWEEIPKTEHGKIWFEQYWIPLCEAMSIDPYAKPRYYESLDFYSTIQKEKGGNSNDSKWEEAKVLWDELTAKPWKAEDYPEVAAWLTNRSPVLDLFGIAVRKANFVCWRPRPKEGGNFAIILPDAQANRNFGRDLSVRITERLGRGDVDGAWYDTMSMFYISRKHYLNDPILVTNLIGIAIEESYGCKMAKTILKYGNPAAEQLEHFAQDLLTLPGRQGLYSDFEERAIYDGLYQLYNGDKALTRGSWGNTEIDSLIILSYFPFDANIAGKRMTEFVHSQDQFFSNFQWKNNPVLLPKYKDKRVSRWSETRKNRSLISFRFWFSLPLIYTRSQMVADCIIDLLCPAYGGIDHALNQANAQLALLRIAVALGRYNKETKTYPESLDALVPKYLDEIPLDPFTRRQTLTYKLKPKDSMEYLIYSYGPNARDDAGIPFDPKNPKNQDISNKTDDIVFER